MNLEQEIEKRAKEIIRFKRKLLIIQLIEKFNKNVKKELKEFGVARSTYYSWKKKYDLDGEEGLKRKKPVARNHPKKISQQVIDKVIELRTAYQLGSIRITWYLERYHDIKKSESSVTRILKKKGLNRLPKSASRRTVHTKRYAKKVPGYPIQLQFQVPCYNFQVLLNNRYEKKYSIPNSIYTRNSSSLNWTYSF